MIDSFLRAVLWVLHWATDRLIEAILRLEDISNRRAALVVTKSPETPAPAERPRVEIEDQPRTAPGFRPGQPTLWN